MALPIIPHEEFGADCCGLRASIGCRPWANLPSLGCEECQPTAHGFRERLRLASNPRRFAEPKANRGELLKRAATTLERHGAIAGRRVAGSGSRSLACGSSGRTTTTIDVTAVSRPEDFTESTAGSAQQNAQWRLRRSPEQLPQEQGPELPGVQPSHVLALVSARRAGRHYAHYRWCGSDRLWNIPEPVRQKAAFTLEQ